ncbi:MAG: alpha/beta fold hydrolase [Pseudomonadota bacterium]
MTGTKATHLETWCRARGHAFLRFDYSGHGSSSGRFEDGTIGAWAQDAEEAIARLTDGPQVLIGSSMGGWISLLMTKWMPKKVAGLITIAAAPDFMEDSYWAGFSEPQRATIMREGRIEVPSDYGSPYVITRSMIEDARQHLVLREPLALTMPTRMLQGSADDVVPVSGATILLDHASGEDIRLIVQKGADHSFSSPSALALLEDATLNVLEALSAT